MTVCRDESTFYSLVSITSEVSLFENWTEQKIFVFPVADGSAGIERMALNSRCVSQLVFELEMCGIILFYCPNNGAARRKKCQRMVEKCHFLEPEVASQGCLLCPVNRAKHEYIIFQLYRGAAQLHIRGTRERFVCLLYK